MSTEQRIAHWQRIIAGQGLTDKDLLYAARQLQAALRERERNDTRSGGVPVGTGVVVSSTTVATIKQNG